ncbi:hypothetical protein [Methylophilus sp. QUAN]|uniref:hypothetical protein n=1 Tax=Methylophilus sp. QUAN TaxID=2781020 RepID=UPI00188EE7BC|nr:hypothetical protein [Methylophilus sp. QUAN]MBF4990685.1 hypothetical protein [Methylophilus sp. QUAN]
MAGVTESNNWSTEVYRFETDDVVEGGEDGLDNLPGKQLAARTNWLRLMLSEVCTAESVTVVDNETTQLLTAIDSRIGNAISELVDSSPAALDTLNELAAALGDDPNFSATILSLLDAKAPKNSPIFTGTPKAPTPPQFASDTEIATTEFVQRALGNLRGQVIASGNLSLTADAVGYIFTTTAAGITLTLPPASGIPNGALCYFNPNGFGVTISAAGSDVIIRPDNSNGSVVSANIDFLTFRRISIGWTLENCPGALKYMPQLFGAQLANNGWQRLPSGRIEVNGTFVSSATPGAPSIVTFPLGASNLRNLQLTPLSTGTTSISAWFDTPSGSGFNGHCSVASAVVHYRAILD